MAPKIVTIIGATGAQGTGVANAFLGSSAYKVRAVTRRPNSDSAERLRARGAEIASADVNDVDSLKAAFVGSHIIYAITDFFEPFAKSGPEAAIQVEVQQGINLATAAASTSTLEHYIWSTLPNGAVVSGGKWRVPHFEGKNRIDEHIRSMPALLAKTTFFWITFYATNFNFPMFTPTWVPSAGKYIQFASFSPSTKITTVGDVTKNVAPFVQAIVSQPEKTQNGVIVKAAIGETTADGFLQTWARTQGKAAMIVPTSAETYNALWPAWGEEMGGMMRFWDEYGDRSWAAPGLVVLGAKDLGIDSAKFVPLEETFKGLTY